MAPHSPGTDQIDTLLWIGFVAAAILIVAINVALIYAAAPLSRRARRRAAPGTRRPRASSSGSAPLLTVFAAVILVLSIIFTDKARETPTTGAAGLAVAAARKPLKIEATGQQWLWRYDYPNGAFSYYKLVVPVDTAVELDLVSTDVVHTWDVPDLAGKRDAVPGKTNHVVFRADEEGDLRRPVGDPLRPGLRGDADRGRRRLAAGIRSLHQAARRADIQAAQDRVVGLIENGEVP